MATVNSRDASIAVNGSFAEAIGFVAALIASGTIVIEEDLVDESTLLVTELGTSFAKARLEVVAEIIADYPDPPKSGGGGGKSGAKNTTSTDPASEKQVKFVNDLLEGRVGAKKALKKLDGESDPDEMNKSEAAAAITALLALPETDDDE